MGLIASISWGQTAEKKTPTSAPPAAQIQLKQPPGLYAVLDTSMGRIVCRLFPNQAPETVKNFVELTKGTKRWYDDKKKAWAKRRYYDGLTFHRVIPNFMIQGGDQMGTGSSNIGFTFKDEFSPDLKFDRPGLLAMANAGPNTNGGQFFITVAATEWLNNRHSIFGEVVEGQDVADMISQVPRDANDKPQAPVVMEKVTIVDRRGEAKPAAPATPKEKP
ncbi:MAG: peptidylprolyl isomerase [Acidobacteria bacterium]|nr:peptidylprolyl isomerase [Acidobacteriota bacterium]